METQVSPLQKLQELLALMGFESGLITKGEDAATDRVIVALDEDRSKAEYEDLLQIYFVEDLLNANLPPEEQRWEGPSNLQFLIALPMALKKLQPPRRLSAYQLLFTLNRFLPLGALGIQNETEDVYYSYTLIAEDQNRNGELIAEIIDLLVFYLPFLKQVLAEIYSEKPLAKIFEDSGLMQAIRAQAK